MGLARAVLVLSALAYGGVGVGFLVAPATLGSWLGVSLSGATADNDVRAVYGGLGVGIAAWCLASAARPSWIRPALSLVAVTLACMAAARVVSWLRVGFPEPIGFALHAAEGVGFLAALVALRRLERSVNGSR
jgi:hypothetical protein